MTLERTVAPIAVLLAGCDVVFDLERPPLECPASYVQIADSYYDRITSKSTWNASELACEAQRVGRGHTHLAVITSDDELQRVHLAFGRVGGWIGLTDLVQPTKFAPITVEPPTSWPPLTSPPWFDGQPNNLDGDQHCLRVASVQDNNGVPVGEGLLDDKPCDDPADEIFQAYCECDEYELDPAATP